MPQARLRSSPRPPARRPRLTLASDLPAVPIQHENLENKIYGRLRDLILQRRILPGQRVPVDALAARMGVSRTPLQNALKRLAQEGVVDWLSRRGIYVRRFTRREMARLFEVREALEGLAARLAASRITAAEVRRLAALFPADDGAREVSDREYIRRDREFHWRLVQLTGNAPLASAMDSINMMFFVYQDGLVRPPGETIPEHRAILAGLRRRDPAASEAAMRTHIQRSIERLERDADAEESGRAAQPRSRPSRTRPQAPRRPGHQA